MPLQLTENRSAGARLNVTANQRARMASVVSMDWDHVTGAPSVGVAYDTRTDAAAATIDSTIDALMTYGYSTLGDGGGARYVKVGVAPTHAGKFQSEDGAWWELAEESLPNALMFGAKNTGSSGDATANTTAITDLLAYIAAAVPGGGGIARIPAGSYYTNGAFTVPDGVIVEGDGPVATAIIDSALTGNIFTLGDGSRLSRLKVTASSTRTSGYSILHSGNGSVSEHLEIEKYHIAIGMVGTDTSTLIVGPKALDIVMRTPSTNAAAGGIFVNFYSNFVIDGLIMTGDGGPSDPQPAYGIRIRHGDTGFIDNTNITVHGKGLLVDSQSGESCIAVRIQNSLFDSAALYSGHISPASGGFVYDMQMSNVWFGIAQSHGLLVQPSGTGVVNGLSIVNGQFADNGGNGLYVDGSGVSNWHIVGGTCAGNTNAGIRASNATTHFRIAGVRSGNVASRGVNDVGILTADACDYYEIVCNDLQGNTSAALTDGATGTNKTVFGNITDSAADGDLTAIEALSSTGLAARTGSGTWAVRTLTAPAAGISVSNGNGVSGNPTLALANDLSALEGMSGTGLVARTASETYEQRTVTASTGISVSNGSGVSGNPTVAIDTSVVPRYANTGTFTAQQIFSTTSDFGSPVQFRVVNDSGTGGPVLYLNFEKASPAVNDSVGSVGYYGKDSAGNVQFYGDQNVYIDDPTSGSEDSRMAFRVVAGGSTVTPMAIGNGVIVGSPTGGYKGAGTLNLAGDAYKNNTAYTNPDYVFEHYYTGEIIQFAGNEGAENYNGIVPLTELRQYTKENLRLPGINDSPSGMFERGDIALAKIEEAHLYIMELHERLSRLESKSE